jgi:precorrin-4/cobalt-precorrin-4 C11-methyltransferase
MAETRATLCIFLSVHNMADVAQTLAGYYGADCPIAVVYRASWPDQQIAQGTLADIAAKVAAAGIGKTAMIVVGRALKRHGAVSRLYSGAFSHGYRKATES